jgi:copper chaperone CopZ
MPTPKFHVPGLRREDEARIERRLRELDGVFAAVLNQADACAEVDFEDDRVSLQEIGDAIREFGYGAEPVG